VITGDRKPLEEIAAMVEGFEHVLIIGCATCVTVCMAGGEREAEETALALALADKDRGVDREVWYANVERQCDEEFLQERVDHLEHRLGKNRFHAIDWISMNQNLFKWIQLEKVIMFLLLALVVVVAAFNIIGILTMMIGERSREIGILMSMGAKRRQILGIFVLDGLFLGMVGTLAGSFLAWLGALYLKKFGFELPGDVYFLDHVPVVVQGTDFLAVGGAAVLISIVFTIIPSWLAARLKPIEIIRYT